MTNVLIVAAGGAIGAAMRYGVGVLLMRSHVTGFPYATLTANVLGCLAMGLLVGWLALRAQGDETVRLFFAVGLLGGFTTFSAFALELVEMIKADAWASAVGYVLLSVVGCAVMVALGLVIMRQLLLGSG